MDYNQVGNAIAKHCGGLSNLLHVTNCMTRVRMTIGDQSKVDIAALKSIEGVLGVVEDDTLQVIVGPGKSSKVANVINDLLKGQPAGDAPLSTVELKAKQAREKAKKQTRSKVILKHIANIFVPILPSLIAAGILMGINNVLVNSAASWALAHHVAALGDLSPTQVVLDQRHMLGVSQFLDIVSKALFGFLAIYTGVTAAKEFDGNAVMGGLLGAITIVPQITALGLIPGQGGLIGVILCAWLMCLLEKQVRRFVPDIIDVVVTPTIVLVVMAAALLFVIMPVAGVVSNGILHGLNGLLSTGGIAAGFVLSALFPFLISLGLHHGLFPIHLEMINATGHAPLFAIQIMSNSGMVGAATAVLLLTRDPVMKKIAKGAIPTSILAVGEPTIFGVNIPVGFAFITGSIGAGFGGMMVVLLGVSTNGIGAAGLSALPLIADGKYLQYIISWLTGCAAAFVLTYIVGKIRGYDKETA
ncbi:permease [Raoultella ornithinolytica]|uniref:PTS system N-acetylmuramic acid-specific EIIBC component n=1 Tax=Klebsiella electrica TaxID=1259973 RepID=A0AAJ5QT38_9ENTR|nr:MULTISPECIES: PTS transporter subunit EIIC [Klebsiella/Raoultella group]KAB8153782.1 PTS sugar transporter subunit IIC [Raoultella ornithinolytica]KAB8163115.1 PTS sugar transporter subunit IIC [Raoultella ornithinolytica]MCT4741429.1 PTS transporter subunit EIIC [Raoultella ornithinolytica]MCW9582209.1 PTS transporter subunit EIIC [Raoultella ornithinolytica]MEB5727974.1 PTS transporter subunit EIIC [Raoultella ornithinolytica]